MANTTTPSVTKIGFVIVLGILAIVGTLLYLGGLNRDRDLVYAETYFENSVSGLSVGSPVNFRGVKIGEVSEIAFVGNYYEVQGLTNQMIYVKMAVPRRLLTGATSASGLVPLTEREALQRFVENLSLRATVTASGITGLSRIELNSQPEVPALKISWLPVGVYIPPAQSLLDNFSDAATRVMNQINKMDIAAVWGDVAASVQAVAKTMESAQATAESRRGDIEKIMGDLSEITASLKDLVEEVKANPSLLIRERIAEPLPETVR